jgi:hypothetical protein
MIGSSFAQGIRGNPGRIALSYLGIPSAKYSTGIRQVSDMRNRPHDEFDVRFDAERCNAMTVRRRSAIRLLAVVSLLRHVLRDAAPGAMIWPQHAAVTTRSANSSISPHGK